MCAFEKSSSYCLTEPDSGSDAQAMKTFAKEDGDYFVLNGSKAFISGAGSTDVYLVMCKTAEKEISCILVEKGTPGLSFGKNEIKMGWNVQPTRLVILEDCKVHKSNLIGKRGQGFKIALSGLDGGRLNIASCSLGGGAKCLDVAAEYIKGRKQFGKPLAENQHLQFKLASMAIELESSRLMVRHAARLLTEKAPNSTMYCAMAKKLATDRCFDVVNDAL
jgi:isobutyryl-CoA dehydrogenase